MGGPLGFSFISEPSPRHAYLLLVHDFYESNPIKSLLDFDQDSKWFHVLCLLQFSPFFTGSDLTCISLPIVALHEQKRLGIFNFPHEPEPKTNQLETFLSSLPPVPNGPLFVCLTWVPSRSEGRHALSAWFFLDQGWAEVGKVVGTSYDRVIVALNVFIGPCCLKCPHSKKNSQKFPQIYPLVN